MLCLCVCVVWCCKESQHKSVFWRNGFCVPTHLSFQLKQSNSTGTQIVWFGADVLQLRRRRPRFRAFEFSRLPKLCPKLLRLFWFLCLAMCQSKWKVIAKWIDVFKDVSCLSVGTVSDGLRIVMFWNSWRKPSSIPILRHIIMGDKVSSRGFIFWQDMFSTRSFFVVTVLSFERFSWVFPSLIMYQRSKLFSKQTQKIIESKSYSSPAFLISLL